jgi:hypothetical protein
MEIFENNVITFRTELQKNFVVKHESNIQYVGLEFNIMRARISSSKINIFDVKSRTTISEDLPSVTRMFCDFPFYPHHVLGYKSHKKLIASFHVVPN